MLGMDLRNFSDACRELYSPGLGLSSYASRGYAFLRRLVSSEFGGCGTLDHRTRALNIGFDTEHPDFVPAMEAFGAVMGKYAIYSFDRTVNNGLPFRRSQFFSDRQFRDLDIYREVYAPLGIDNHCALHVPSRKGETLFFFLERSGGPDFSDEELAVLTEAQVHLGNALRLCLTCANPDESPIDAATLVKAGLTPREADTLLWMCQGKSNSEIAIILGISLHTVKDHVAAIFDKAGVGNRVAAILWARRICRQEQADSKQHHGDFIQVPTSIPPSEVG